MNFVDDRFNEEVESCTTINSNKKICLSDSGSRSRCHIINHTNKKLEVIEVDQCISSLANKKKCDYCVKDGDNKAIYVELKGKKIDHAIAQLSSTISHFLSLHGCLARECYAVVSRVPKGGTDVQNYKTRFRRDHNAPLFVIRSGHQIEL